ncbi:MAG: RNA ligase family protein, partial [Cyanobacteria bacterium P01_G01_bin.49]
YAKDDLIGNPALGIVDALKPKVEKIGWVSKDKITVFYCEVYGGKITQASKQYTGEKKVGYRLFDIVEIPDYDSLLEKPIFEISKWRDHNGQSFVDESQLQEIAKDYRFELTPRVIECLSDEFPKKIEDTLMFLKKTLSKSLCLLDETGRGQPEGLVVRTLDRSQIAKLRFQDYERTLKRRKSK